MCTYMSTLSLYARRIMVYPLLPSDDLCSTIIHAIAERESAITHTHLAGPLIQAQNHLVSRGNAACYCGLPRQVLSP